MATVARASTASADVSNAKVASQVVGLTAGEALEAGAPCHVESDGLVYLSAAGESVQGFAAAARNTGEAITLIGAGARFNHAASGLTAGDVFGLGATAGALDDSPAAGNEYAFAINATDIMCFRLVP